jgi:hypothetical protein
VCALLSAAQQQSGFVEKNKKAVAHPKCWAGILLKGTPPAAAATADFKYT